MIRVSAGVIRNAAGEILICRRGEGRKNAHLWEFPGGKREAGEDAAACLSRELLEELSLPVRNLSPLCELEQDGILFSFLTGETDALPRLTEHEEACSVPARAMLGFRFCPADTPVALALALREPPIRAVFWDFDGTLFDTYPLLCRALIAACGKLGVPLARAEALALMKNSLSHALASIARERHVDPEALAAAFREEEALTPPEAFPLMPGTAEAVRTLTGAGCRHFLVTHRDRGALRALDAAGLLPLFSGWVTKEDGFPRKPDPACVRHLLQANRLDPAAACMVGDRPLDVQAGQGAGMPGILFDPDGCIPGDFPLRAGSTKELTALILGQLPG